MRDLLPFCELTLRPPKSKCHENSKWPHPSILPPIKKIVTLFDSIVKVGENKISLFFSYRSYEGSMGIF